MPTESKLGLVAGLVAVCLIAVIYYQKPAAESPLGGANGTAREESRLAVVPRPAQPAQVITP